MHCREWGERIRRNFFVISLSSYSFLQTPSTAQITLFLAKAEECPVARQRHVFQEAVSHQIPRAVATQPPAEWWRNGDREWEARWEGERQKAQGIPHTIGTNEPDGRGQGVEKRRSTSVKQHGKVHWTLPKDHSCHLLVNQKALVSGTIDQWMPSIICWKSSMNTFLPVRHLK